MADLETVTLGINATHARKGKVHAELLGLAGIQEVKPVDARASASLRMYTLIAKVAPEQALQLIKQIEGIHGVEGVYRVSQPNEDAGGVLV